MNRFEGTCLTCGCWKPICRCNSIGTFKTYRDRLYHFTDVNTTGKPIEFTSKGEWRRHLKRLGLHDDVKQSPRYLDKIPCHPQKPFEKGEFKKVLGEAIQDRKWERDFKEKIIRGEYGKKDHYWAR